MSIPVEELTKNDYLILEYINRFSSVHKTDIEKHFNGKIASLDYRLSVLAKSKLIEEKFKPNTGGYSNPHKSLNIFYITDFGKAILQDHFAKKKSEIRNRIIAISTLVLSAITAVASVIAALK